MRCVALDGNSSLYPQHIHVMLLRCLQSFVADEFASDYVVSTGASDCLGKLQPYCEASLVLKYLVYELNLLS